MSNKPSINDLIINPKILEENGYQKYTDSLADKNTYVGSWQKCVRNEYGKAYFINFNFSDMSYYSTECTITLYNLSPYHYECDLQFNDSEDGSTINVKIFSTSKTLEQIELYIDKMFHKMQFRNYEYYDEEDEQKHYNEFLKNKKLEEATKLSEALQPKATKNKKLKV